MRSDDAVKGFVLIEVDELAFRFREDRDLIKKALDHLEKGRKAQETEFEGLWRVPVPLSEATQ
jgi:hypothetical protein